MIETIIVMVGLCAIAFILSKADVKVTVTKSYKDETPQPVVKQMSDEELKAIMDEQAKMPTYDAVLKEIQKAIGGIGDE